MFAWFEIARIYTALKLLAHLQGLISYEDLQKKG